MYTIFQKHLLTSAKLPAIQNICSSSYVYFTIAKIHFFTLSFLKGRISDMDPDIVALITVGLISLSFLIIVFSILGLYFYWYARLRLPPVQMVAPYIPNPPEKLSPGAAGLLLGEVDSPA